MACPFCFSHMGVVGSPPGPSLPGCQGSTGEPRWDRLCSPGAVAWSGSGWGWGAGPPEDSYAAAGFIPPGFPRCWGAHGKEKSHLPRS